MSKVLNSFNFEEEVLNYKGVVLVDFFTEWCGYCELLEPELEQVEQELTSIKFVRIDAEKSSDVADAFHIEFYPEMLIFKDGKLVGHIDGYMKADDLKERLKEWC